MTEETVVRTEVVQITEQTCVVVVKATGLPIGVLVKRRNGKWGAFDLDHHTGPVYEGDDPEYVSKHAYAGLA